MMLALWPCWGCLRSHDRNKPKAESYYKKALQIQPMQPVAANNLAYMMLMNGENADVALTLAQTARRSLPDFPQHGRYPGMGLLHEGGLRFRARSSGRGDQGAGERRNDGIPSWDGVFAFGKPERGHHSSEEGNFSCAQFPNRQGRKMPCRP
jgi:tetratricopeptide (TPR) repeat protein